MAERILIVEDEGILSMDLQFVLEAGGFEVTGITASGEKALESMRDTGADLVLMDIELKGEMDGAETAERIMRHFNIPVIYMSAHRAGPILERIGGPAPIAFFSKPVEGPHLCRTIREMLDIHGPGKL